MGVRVVFLLWPMRTLIGSRETSSSAAIFISPVNYEHSELFIHVQQLVRLGYATY